MYEPSEPSKEGEEEEEEEEEAVYCSCLDERWLSHYI